MGPAPMGPARPVRLFHLASRQSPVARNDDRVQKMSSPHMAQQPPQAYTLSSTTISGRPSRPARHSGA